MVSPDTLAGGTLARSAKYPIIAACIAAKPRSAFDARNAASASDSRRSASRNARLARRIHVFAQPAAAASIIGGSGRVPPARPRTVRS
jgi:hypothetical protein